MNCDRWRTGGCAFNLRESTSCSSAIVLPELLFAGNPGALVSPTFAESFAKGLKNCRVVQLDSGIHYLQEDNAEIIGATVNEWLIDLGIGSAQTQGGIISISSDAWLRAFVRVAQLVAANPCT